MPTKTTSARRAWSQEDDEILRTNYGRLAVEQVAADLHRSKASVNHRACKLGLTEPRSRWTEEQDAVLKGNYQTRSDQEIAELLDGLYTPIAIARRRGQLGLTGKKPIRWTTADIARLKEAYGSVSAEDLASELGRSVTSIHIKANRMGLSFGPKLPKKKKLWTEQEQEFLRKYWGRVALDWICQTLKTPARTVLAMAWELGLPDLKPRAWTKEEDQILANNGNDTAAQIQKRLPHRQRRDIRQRRTELGLTTFKVGRPWTEDEVAALRNETKNHASFCIDAFADTHNRTTVAIKSKCIELGLTWYATDEEPEWTETDLVKLESMWGRIPIKGLAVALGRSEKSVCRQAKKQGLGAWMEASEYISINQVLRAIYPMAEDSTLARRAARWERERGLPIKRIRFASRKAYRMTRMEKFWAWADKNRDLLDFSEFERLSLGPEPDWVAEKRSQDYRERQTYCKSHGNLPWTGAEDDKLTHLLSDPSTPIEIAARELMRTERAICTRAAILGLPPRQTGPGDTWTPEQLERMADLIKTKDSWYWIAKDLGRTEISCQNKARRAYLTSNLRDVRKHLERGNWVWGAGFEPPIGKRQNAVAVQQGISRLCSLLQNVVQKNEDHEDKYIQRNLCLYWDIFKGCTMGCETCDICQSFQRKEVEYCIRCGAELTAHTAGEKLCKTCRTRNHAA